MGFILLPFKIVSIPAKFALGLFGVILAACVVAHLSGWVLYDLTNWEQVHVRLVSLGLFVLTIWSGYHGD